MLNQYTINLSHLQKEWKHPEPGKQARGATQRKRGRGAVSSAAVQRRCCVGKNFPRMTYQKQVIYGKCFYNRKHAWRNSLSISVDGMSRAGGVIGR